MGKKLKVSWLITDIPKHVKIKLWLPMKDNPTYQSWQEAIARVKFEPSEEKYVRLTSDTYQALKIEVGLIPLTEVNALPEELKSWIFSLRQDLKTEKAAQEVIKTRTSNSVEFEEKKSPLEIGSGTAMKPLSISYDEVGSAITTDIEINPREIPDFDYNIFDPNKDEDYSTFYKDTPFLYPLELKLEISKIIIENIRIRSSTPQVPFRFIITESKIEWGVLLRWKEYDLLEMAPVRKAVYTCDQLLEYENQDSNNVLHCGIVVYFNQKPVIATSPFYLEPIAPGLGWIPKRGENPNGALEQDIEEEVDQEDKGVDIEENNKLIYDTFRESITYQITIKYRRVTLA